MKVLASVLVYALLAGNAVAADYGLGISGKSDSGFIYIPIDLSRKFRIEPHIRYLVSDSDSIGVVAPGFPAEVRQESEMLEIGVGFFGLSLPKESVRVYYGGRIGYQEAQTDTVISAGQSTNRESSSGDGYSIAPTLGFEYIFNRHFTLGGEIAYMYQHSDSRTSRNSLSTVEGERTGTESFIVLRYFF